MEKLLSSDLDYRRGAACTRCRSEFPANSLFIASVTDKRSETEMQAILDCGSDWVCSRPLNLAEFFGP
jgi:hypothetical protein